MKQPRFLFSVLLLPVLALTACQSTSGASAQLGGSGQISALTVTVASDLGGKVKDVLVHEGDKVTQGQVVLHLDDTVLQAQLDQANASVKVAQAAVDSAQQAQDAAQAQYDLTLANAQAQVASSRYDSWKGKAPDNFNLPLWYYSQSESITAAQTEVDAAKTALDQANSNLTSVENGVGSNFVDAEKRLANARQALLTAQVVQDQANAGDNADLKKQAQDLYNSAQSELSAAQDNYTRLLSTQQASDVLEARARVAVAQARYDTAVDRLNALYTGDQSLQVKAADATLKQAQAGLNQAQASLGQAQAQVQLIQAQLAKTQVQSPMAGTVVTRSVEPGEVLSPGATALTIAQLDPVKLTVYLPEDQYGKVNLGDRVAVTVDSYAGQTFDGTVTRIADQAEFTPKNVQTVEGRQSTVYGIDITLPNPDQKLKPGMPADAVILK
jgi:HlyD family secretion protein